MLDTTQPTLATRSIDRARAIRRSMRCFVFGTIGLVPIIGAGLAVQALRLRESISAELGESWKPPPLYLYWLLGLGMLLVADQHFGLVGSFTVCLLVCGAQSVHLHRSYLSLREGAWNPGRRALLWGMTFGYAGLVGTFAVLAVIIFRLAKIGAPL